MRIAIALLVAAFAAVAIGVALAFGFAGLSPLASALALTGGAVVGSVSFPRIRTAEQTGKPIHPVEWMLIGIFALACLRAYFWLLYPNDGKLFILSPNNLGDIALHLDLIRYLASGVPFWPQSPILTGEPLKYPIGADFFNSLLLRIGLPVEQSLIWVGLGGSAITAVALWRWGRGFALAAFLFGGGLAGFAWLSEAFKTGSFALQDVQATATWKNLFLALFVTQRGLLFALPAGLLLLDYWRARFLRGSSSTMPAWAALLLYATMPLYNVHTFIFLSIALAGTFLFARDQSAKRGSFLFALSALAPAALCAALVTGGFSASGGIHWKIGWMQDSEPGVSPVWFWLHNFGLYLILWAVLVGITVARGSRETRAVVLAATLMFLLCCFVSFAVWPWDNTKILLWCWLAVAPCIWSEILAPLPIVPRAIVCIVLFFTGALSLAAGLDGRHGYSLVDIGLVDNAAAAVRKIDPNARFACAPEYWHPLILLGRKVALGYDGHLWSHGLNYQPKMALLDNLMNARPGWEESAQRLGVDYLYWGTPETNRYPASAQNWSAVLPVVASGTDFTIYRLPTPR